MPTPNWQAAGTNQQGTGAVAVPWPASHAVNDVAFLLVQSQGGQAATLTTPAGFAQAFTANTGTGAGSVRLTVFWCRATSSAMPTPTVANPGDHVVARISTFRGCLSIGNPWEQIVTAVQASASTAATLPAGRTTRGKGLLVFIAAHAVDSPSSQVSGFAGPDLTNEAERFDNSTNAGTGGGFALMTAERHSVTPGSFGVSTATLAASSKQVNALITLLSAEVIVSPGIAEQDPPGSGYPPGDAKWAGFAPTVLQAGTTGLALYTGLAPAAVIGLTGVNDFVDIAQGADPNTGVAAGAAWKTIAKANSVGFVPGTTVNFRRGGLRYPWREKLVCDAVGTAGQPIRYTGFGNQVSYPSKALAPAPPAPLRSVFVSTKAELDTARTNALPGDHIFCTAGTYSFAGGGNYVWNKSGTVGAPIVIWGAGTPGHHVAPTTIFSDNNNDVFSITGNYVQIRYIAFANWFYGPWVDGCTGSIYDSCEARNSSQEAFHPRNNASFCYIQRCHVHDTGGISNQFAEANYLGLGGADATNNIYLLRNWTHDHKAEALESADPIHDCWYEGNYLDGFGEIYQPGVMNAVVSIAGQNHTYVRNIVRYAAPYGFYFQGGVTNSGHVLRDNRVAVFDKNNPVTADGFHRQGGTVAELGLDNLVTDIPSGGSAFFGLTATNGYAEDLGVTPRPQILASELPIVWVKDAQVNTWYTTVLTSDPLRVWFDRVLGTRATSLALTNGALKWWWDNATLRLYVFSLYHPSCGYQTPGIEAAQRDSAVEITANYTILQSLDLWGGRTATLSIAPGLVGVQIIDTYVDGVLYVQSGGATVGPDVGVGSYAGFAPTVLTPKVASAGLGVGSYTGQAPAVVAPVVTAPALGQGSYTGIAPVVLAAGSVAAAPGTGVGIWSGFAPGVVVIAATLVQPGVGVALWQGFVPSVNQPDTYAWFPGDGEFRGGKRYEEYAHQKPVRPRKKKKRPPEPLPPLAEGATGTLGPMLPPLAAPGQAALPIHMVPTPTRTPVRAAPEVYEVPGRRAGEGAHWTDYAHLPVDPTEDAEELRILMDLAREASRGS